jgi:hypothetical protein
MAESKLSPFEAVVGAFTFVAIFALGYCHFRLSLRQDEQEGRIERQREEFERSLLQLQREADEKRAADSLELQLISVASPHLSRVRDSGRDAATSQRIVAAAGELLAARGRRRTGRERQAASSPRSRPRAPRQHLQDETERPLRRGPRKALGSIRGRRDRGSSEAREPRRGRLRRAGWWLGADRDGAVCYRWCTTLDRSCSINVQEIGRPSSHPMRATIDESQCRLDGPFHLRHRIRASDEHEVKCPGTPLGCRRPAQAGRPRRVGHSAPLRR